MNHTEEEFLTLLNLALANELTVEQEIRLQLLLEQDPQRMQLYGFLKLSEDTERERLEIEVLYEKSRPNDLPDLIPSKVLPVSPQRLFPWKTSLKIAAAILLIFSFIFLLRQQNTTIRGNWMELSSEKGERKYFKLIDGTEVWLNSDSKLLLKPGYGKEHREMRLLGEGYFSVAKNKALPMKVSVRDVDVNVIGTVFNLRAYPEQGQIVTSLIEGKVKLTLNETKGRKDFVMKPGDRVEIERKEINGEISLAVADSIAIQHTVAFRSVEKKDDKALDALWTENKLVFKADRLPVVVKRLERWYNVPIVIENNLMKEQAFTGVFEEPTCQQVLSLLQKTNKNLKYMMKGDTIIIK
ncbi:DUF4974 domain-containing protein [Sphingobacterium sp. DK4209]|uniref:DUF4974 domain-containing protein n=1 Tax=Sphingobacterium zhuxiongii TaxID=2662364 RepID=A0A5Q0QDH2_9SPHI|nr:MULTISPECIES: FecR domain-containing protein [unclassified Sphingobacterium]MVZ65675.1 DUF4974 domain-containing protein [Sphingobacterium sp. DK4209]QGA27875.1 DUF4974 domain-containing protein [Sphingobacterium sp. dk4302]